LADLERVRTVVERLLEGGRLSPVSIGPAEGEALRESVRRSGARRTLEAGLGWAVSTLFICEGLLENGGGCHVAADPFQLESRPLQRTHYEGAGLRALDEAGVRELVEFYPEESQVVFPRLLAEGRRFDLAFIDGNHRFEGVFLDLFYAGRLLEEGGVVFADDVQLPAVRRAVDFCLANLGWTVEEEGAGGDVHEWIVLRTGPPDAFLRPFDAFVDF
jgi:predicted O-methyltransferase YrrM